jgi:hypothetical protein
LGQGLSESTLQKEYWEKLEKSMSSLNTLQSDKTKILIVLKSFHSIMVPDRNLLWPNLNDLGALKLKLFHSTQNKLN